MNILYVTHYSDLYGANRSLLALLDGLKPYNVKPFVLLPSRGKMLDELEKREIHHAVLPFKNWMAKSRLKMPFRLIMNLFCLPILLYKVKGWDIDLVHTNSSVTPIGAWMAHLSGLPHIWHIREFGWEDYDLKYDLGSRLFRFWMNRARLLISVSHTVDKKVVKGNGITAESRVIYNGVIDEEKAKNINDINQVNFSNSKVIFGIIGLLHPAKGQEHALRAFAKVLDKNPERFIELKIAGSGDSDYQEYLINLANRLGISEVVTFLGYVDDPFSFFENIDVALVCSKNEGMGRVTAEAMVTGKVIIGLDNAGTSELIDNNINGLLYDGSVRSLTSKMHYVINHDVQELAKNAKSKGLNNFTIEHYANQVLDAYMDSVAK